MSNGFKNRLKRLHGARKRASERSDSDENRVFVADDVDERVNQAADRVQNPLADVEERWERLGATETDNDAGRAALIQRNHAQSMQHGHVRLVEAAACSLEALLDTMGVATPPSPSVQNAVFLDLETTGLSKSDYAFCVGVGLWEGSRFVVRHHIMRREDEERAALLAFLSDLSRDGLLVTFNGRSFDVPMLRRRLEHHDIAHPLDDIAHLDLLEVSRKVWPDRDTHKLSAVEADICGLERHDDVSGGRIPQLWRAYLEDGEPGRLFGVFKHNRLDIVSLLALLPDMVGACGGAGTPSPTASSRSNRTRSSPRNRSKKPEKRLQKNHEVSTKKDTRLKQSLSRNYKLRSKARGGQGGAVDNDRDEAPRERNSVQLGGSFSRSKLREKMPVGQHIRDLRKRVESSEDAEVRTALLHEILAIEPRHPFALRELAAAYREAGKHKLAEVLERRLEDTAPY